MKGRPHIGDKVFGLGIDHSEFLYEAIRKIPRAVDAITAKMTMTEMYEASYGIFNHFAQGMGKMRPLSTVALHPSENRSHYDPFKALAKTYADKIKGLFGISLLEFLELPSFRVRELIEIADEIRKHEADLAAAIANRVGSPTGPVKKY